MLENPPPEKITCSHAPSGSVTLDPGLTCVAPTAVMKGQVTYAKHSEIVSFLRTKIFAYGEAGIKGRP